MPELRIDPIVGRKVLVAEDRDGRPFDFAKQSELSPTVKESAVECCFCTSHESETPPAVAEIPDGQGGWRVRVVPNKFPAFSLAEPIDGAFGAHEVVIESPRHDRDWLDLSVGQIHAVLTAYALRLRHWSADDRMRHALVFKNSGPAAGASLEHVHSQLVATSCVADVVQAELDACHAFHRQGGQPLFSAWMDREVASGERLVARGGGFVAICAYAGRQPFETWVLPERHTARYETTSEEALSGLAQLIHAVLGAMRDCMPRFSYNLMLHTAPFDGQWDDCFRWHWEVLPRRSQLAGIEVGGGYFINSVAPERAAAQLRQSLADQAAAAESGHSARSGAGSQQSPPSA